MADKTYPTTLTFGSAVLGDLVSVGATKRSVASLRRKTFASADELVAAGTVVSAAEITATCIATPAVFSGEGDVLGSTGTLTITYPNEPADTWTGAFCVGFEVGAVDAESEKLGLEVTYTFLVPGSDPVA